MKTRKQSQGEMSKYVIGTAYQRVPVIGKLNEIKALKNASFYFVEEVLAPNWNLCEGNNQRRYRGEREKPITKEEISELEKTFGEAKRNIVIHRLEKI